MEETEIELTLEEISQELKGIKEVLQKMLELETEMEEEDEYN